jgi:serine kinase of HPr protein (carbohydrate metabolism regulator)
VIRHAGLIARFEGGGWRGVLIEGPSGSGKSDLMLRALADGWRLVADDRTLVWAEAGRPFGRAPETIAGLVEVRGLGVLPAARRAFAEIVLVARCVASGEVERLPEPAMVELQGATAPQVLIAPFEASATVKLACALRHIGLGRQQAYQAARAGQVCGAPRGVS